MVNKNKVIISTTSTIQGRLIEEYLDVVSVFCVLGLGFISDIAASFTDMLGGHSQRYENQMKEMLDYIKAGLYEKAEALGGNAVVSVKIDFDEISGKGMQMMMVVATGTCVKLVPEEKTAKLPVVNLFTELPVRPGMIDIDLKKTSEGSQLFFSIDCISYIDQKINIA